MNADELKNKEFQRTFCENNLRWLAGDPPSDERTQKMQYMQSEIERLRLEIVNAQGLLPAPDYAGE